MRTATMIPLLVTGAVGVGVAASSATAGSSDYRMPVAGKWKVVDMGNRVAGGTARIAKGGSRVAALSVDVGTSNQRSCGTIKRLAIAKSVRIKRVGTSRRPAVGRINKRGLIDVISTKIKVDGAVKNGKAMVIWEKDGKQALDAKLIVGDCHLWFMLRKAK